MGNLIIGQKFGSLKEGYGINVNMNKVKPFVVNKDGSEIPFGSLLVRTSITKSYNAAQNLVADTITIADQIVGVSLSTNVKLNTVFPGGNANVGELPGEHGNNLFVGEIAVQYVGATPLENTPAYIITNNGDQSIDTLGRISTAAASVGTETKVLLPNFKFSGITDTDAALTVINKIY